MAEELSYKSYVVRLWPGEHEGRGTCRVTLDAVGSGRRHDFSGLDGLVAFLRAEEAALTALDLQSEEDEMPGISTKSTQKTAPEAGHHE
jgi:hypothetical protein